MVDVEHHRDTDGATRGIDAPALSIDVHHQNPYSEHFHLKIARHDLPRKAGKSKTYNSPQCGPISHWLVVISSVSFMASLHRTDSDLFSFFGFRPAKDLFES